MSEIRRVIEGVAIPEDIAEEITHFLSRLGEKDPFAMRVGHHLLMTDRYADVILLIVRFRNWE